MAVRPAGRDAPLEKSSRKEMVWGQPGCVRSNLRAPGRGWLGLQPFVAASPGGNGGGAPVGPAVQTAGRGDRLPLVEVDHSPPITVVPPGQVTIYRQGSASGCSPTCCNEVQQGIPFNLRRARKALEQTESHEVRGSVCPAPFLFYQTRRRSDEESRTAVYKARPSC